MNQDQPKGFWATVKHYCAAGLGAGFGWSIGSAIGSFIARIFAKFFRLVALLIAAWLAAHGMAGFTGAYADHAQQTHAAQHHVHQQGH